MSVFSYMPSMRTMLSLLQAFGLYAALAVCAPQLTPDDQKCERRLQHKCGVASSGRRAFCRRARRRTARARERAATQRIDAIWQRTSAAATTAAASTKCARLFFRLEIADYAIHLLTLFLRLEDARAKHSKCLVERAKRGARERRAASSPFLRVAKFARASRARRAMSRRLPTSVRVYSSRRLIFYAEYERR